MLARVISVLTLLLLVQPIQGAALVCVASQLSLAAHEPRDARSGAESSPGDGCCAGEEGPESESEPHENCPCPFPCASGCSGQPRGLVPSTALLQRLQPLEIAVLTPSPERSPSNPEPRGIMHVPKRAARALS